MVFRPGPYRKEAESNHQPTTRLTSSRAPEHGTRPTPVCRSCFPLNYTLISIEHWNSLLLTLAAGCRPLSSSSAIPPVLNTTLPGSDRHSEPLSLYACRTYLCGRMVVGRPQAEAGHKPPPLPGSATALSVASCVLPLLFVLCYLPIALEEDRQWPEISPS